MRARVIGGLPADLVGSLTGLTQGRFPVHAKATYAGELTEGRQQGARRGDNAASSSSPTQHAPRHRDLRPAGRPGRSPSTTARSSRIGHDQAPRPASSSSRTSTATRTPTGTSATVAKTYPAPKPRKTDARQIRRELELPERDAKPTRAASATKRAGPQARRAAQAGRRAGKPRPPAPPRCRRRARQGAPVRPPGAPERARPPAATPSSATPAIAGRLRRPLGLDAKRLRRQAARARAARRRRHDPRPHRQDRRRRSAAAPAVRDPPGRPRRPAHRPEADPRRLEAARVDRDLPRQGQEPVLRRRRRDARRSARSC